MDAHANVFVTGSNGLVGSEAVELFDRLGHTVVGIDNNMRLSIFGPAGDTRWNRDRLQRTCRRFIPVDVDIRDARRIERLFCEHRPSVVLHAAAQPSHDYAASAPLLDFEINALGTMILLEATRQFSPDAAFIFMSSNKVYGDGPNSLALCESSVRFDFADEQYRDGISESFPIDNSLHSIFGVSKCAADLMVQEYGRYYGLRTCTLRGGCLTGRAHSGVKLHGFLSYLVQCALDRSEYTIIGYEGKQVRDQIHSQDVVGAIWHIANHLDPGTVYNLGGGRDNSASILEVIQMIESRLGSEIRTCYEEQPRIGDHKCYYTDVSKLRARYPQWSVTRSLENILDELISDSWHDLRKASHRVP